jgi:hypothetical protein
MEPYIGHLISVIVMLGGLVGVYTRIVARLSKIETRLEIDDKGKDDRQKIRAAETREIVRAELKEHSTGCAALNEHKAWNPPSNVGMQALPPKE